jgi:hypothetical protein
MTGKVFRAHSGDECGPLRPAESSFPADIASPPFATDSCGNYFLVDLSGAVLFWDHETSELTVLAETWNLFVAALHIPEVVELKPGQVKRVWVDPEFAAKHGLKKGPK